MEEQYIELRNTRCIYASTVAKLENDPAISPRNKELIRKFLRDAALGKTIIGKAKKKIGHGALVGYVYHLYPFIFFLKKDLDQVTMEDTECFIEALENDEIRSRSPRIKGYKPCRSGQPYSDRYKVDMKVVIRKFYKWLWGENKRYPEIVEWFDTYTKDKEVPALTEIEVERMLDHARTPLQRALVQVLYDGGFRIGELLNIRLRHVRLQNYDPKDPDRTCFSLRVPFSKTLPRTVPLPMHATSKWLSMWLEVHPARPIFLEDGRLTATDEQMQLFPLSDSEVRHLINRLGRRALNKRVYPHLLRHSSATYWCQKLPYFVLCKRFGWTMTSKMPQKYIDREGINDLAAALIYHESESLKRTRNEQRLSDKNLERSHGTYQFSRIRSTERDDLNSV